MGVAMKFENEGNFMYVRNTSELEIYELKSILNCEQSKV